MVVVGIVGEGGKGGGMDFLAERRSEGWLLLSFWENSDGGIGLG